MERVILDTGVLIAVERETAPTGDLIPDGADVAIAAVTLAELLVGVEMADAARRDRRQRIVDLLTERLEIVAYDQEVARHHAGLLAASRRAGRPRGAHDLQIAATALATDRVVITTDTKAFDELPGVAHRLIA